MKKEKLVITLKDLPLIVELKKGDKIKEYVIKVNKLKDGIFLNKIEKY